MTIRESEDIPQLRKNFIHPQVHTASSHPMNLEIAATPPEDYLQKKMPRSKWPSSFADASRVLEETVQLLEGLP